MILTQPDAEYAANVFTEFFANFERIDDYMRQIKMERMDSMPFTLPGMGPEEDMFTDFDMHPKDMELTIGTTPLDQFMSYMNITTSAIVEASIPGKMMNWVVREKNTGMVVGMIRFGSPTINSRPRNEWLGKPLDTMNGEVMKRFNKTCIMGFSIVPAQPFGFNSLVVSYLQLYVPRIRYVRHLIRSMMQTSVCSRQPPYTVMPRVACLCTLV